MIGLLNFSTRRTARAAVLLVGCFMLVAACTGQGGVLAASKTITVYVNGEAVKMKDAAPVVKNGRTLVPFRPLLETLGFEVGWTRAGGKSTVSGTRQGLAIRLTIDDRNASVNGKNVTLDVPALIVNGQTMVPLRFVSEHSGYEVAYAEQGGATVIRISDKKPAVDDGTGNNESGGNGRTDSDEGGGDAGAADDGQAGHAGNGAAVGDDVAESYVLKGRVVDSDGHPVRGATIYADNQLLYNSNEVGITDAAGRYRIELEALAATWHASGEAAIELNGQSVDVALTPDSDDPFAGNAGAVRNFTLQTATGSVIFHMADLWNPADITLPPPAQEDVELTMEPVGETAGTAGRKYVGHGQVTNDGFGMPGVPVGRYKITARYVPEGEPAQNMLIRPSSGGEYRTSMEADFVHVIASFYKIEIEVKLPFEGGDAS